MKASFNITPYALSIVLGCNIPLFAQEIVPEDALNTGISSLLSSPKTSIKEVRGTWVTTTANTAIATPANTAATMKKLADIGLNTVYVEVWKNGYTQYASQVLKRTIGVDRRPPQALQDPSDGVENAVQNNASNKGNASRDLLQETAIGGSVGKIPA